MPYSFTVADCVYIEVMLCPIYCYYPIVVHTLAVLRKRGPKVDLGNVFQWSAAGIPYPFGRFSGWTKPDLTSIPFYSRKMQFSGHEHLRTRLVLSLLSGKSLKVTGIRSQDKDPGLRGSSTFRPEEPISTDRTTALPSYSKHLNFLQTTKFPSSGLSKK